MALDLHLRQPDLPDQRPPLSDHETERAEAPAAPDVREKAPEVVHHPASFLRHRLPIGTDRAIKAFLLLIPGVWVLGYLFPPINHDVAAVMDVAHRWLEGDRLYVDIIDVNLPFVFMLYAIPDLLSRAFSVFGLGPEPWLGLWFAAATFASFLACRSLTHRVPSLAHPLTEALIPPTLLFLFIVLPQDQFGQREHLMLIGTAPYMLHAAVRAEGRERTVSRWATWAIGIAAGIVLAQKPHFMAIPIAIESYLLLHRGWRRTLGDVVPWTIAAFALAHVAFVLLVTPAYVTTVMPIIWDTYALVSATTWQGVLFGPIVLPCLLAMAACGLLAIFLARTVAARVIVAYGLGAALVAITQAKGFGYHVLPGLAATILLGAVTMSQMIDRYLPIDRDAHRLPVAAISAAFLILLYLQAAVFMPPFRNQSEFDDSISSVLLHIVQQHAPRKRVLILSPRVHPHYPLVNYGRIHMTMRFQTMWILRGIYENCDDYPTLYNAPEDMSATERFVFDSVSEDFERQQPDLLIIDRQAEMPRCQSRTFDYLEYFMRNPRFARAFERYAHFMDVDRYTIYKRR